MKKMKMLVQTTLNDVVRLNAGSGRRMNGKTVLAIVIVFLLLGAGVVNSTRYITSTTDSALYANKWNLTTYSFNNSKVWWASWNASSGAGSSITSGDRAKWNATNGSVQRFQSQWNSTSGSGTTYPGKWNLTTTQFNNSKLSWILWNATRTGLIGWGHNWNTTKTQFNLTQTGFNNSKNYWTLWNLTKTRLAGYGHNWNNTMQKLNNSQSFWTKWNVTNSSVQRFQSQWNATSGGGNYAPNVTYITNSKGNKFSNTGAGLQLAIYDLNSTHGGKVTVPSGNTYVLKTIYLINRTTLIGSGVGVTYIKSGNGFSGDSGIFISIWRTGNKRFNNVTISDMTINGNSSAGNGIYCVANEDFRFYNLHITNCTGNAMWIGTEGQPWCNRGFVDNILSSNTMSGAGYEGFAFNNITNTTFSNLHATHGSGAFQVDFHGIRNSTINNIIASNGGGVKLFGEGIYYCQDVVMNNIVCKNMTTGTATNEALWIRMARRVSINNVQTLMGYNGIKIDASYDININNGFIQSPKNVGFYIINSYRINVNNIIVRNSVSYGLNIYTCNNISVSNLQVFSPTNYNYMYNSKYIKITNSIFAGGSSYGLDIDVCARVKIDSCSFLNNAEDGITTEIGGCYNYTITNCDFIGNDRAIDIKSTDNYFIVSNCICDSNDAIDVNAALTNLRRVNDTICTLVTS